MTKVHTKLLWNQVFLCHNISNLARAHCWSVIWCEYHGDGNDPTLTERALKVWGDGAHKAVDAEMKQLHWCESFKTSQQKAIMVLESHAFVTKKTSGELKARQVASGNKQCDFITKEESSSPTVANESITLSSVLDAIENCKVITVDIPNAFIQMVVENERDHIIICIWGHLVDVLTRIPPEVYSKFITINAKGEK